MGLVTCPDCGHEVSDTAPACPQCGRPAQPIAPSPVPLPIVAPTPMGQDPAMRMLLPVGRSWWAIAAGYLGLLSITGWLAPFAVVCGVVAIVDIRRHPERHGMGRAIFGIVMGVLGIGVLLFVLFYRPPL